MTWVTSGNNFNAMTIERHEIWPWTQLIAENFNTAKHIGTEDMDAEQKR